MTITRKRRAAHISLTGLVAAAVIAGTALPASAHGRKHGHAPTHAVTLMTRNLYLGADFTPLLTVSGAALPGAVVGILSDVAASQPAVRMAQVAAEIHASHPDVVALQEAASWTSAVPGLTYSFDFTQMVLADLGTLGDQYTVAVDKANFDSLDLLVGSQLPGRFVDHDVLLVKRGTAVKATGGAHFADQLTYTSASIGPVTFTRGYEWADLKLPRGPVYRVVNTHLEAYSAAVAGAQAAQLVTVLTDTRNPTIVAGDLNSDPALDSGAAALALQAAGYRDAWTRVHPTLPGFTCCEAGSLTGPADGSALDQRIDHVYAKGHAHAVAASLVGVVAFRATAPMWPSDHAGLVVTYVIGHRH